MNSSNSLTGNGSNHRHFSGTHYVVSEDVDILISRWCEGANMLSPSIDFYVDLRTKMQGFLQDIFARVTFINSSEIKIKEDLLESIAIHRKSGLEIVSLERAYLEDCDVDGRIEFTRTVDGDGDEIQIPSVRRGSPEKRFQFERLRGKQIALVDDVIFSGKTIAKRRSENRS